MAFPPGMNGASMLVSHTSCSSCFLFLILLSEDRMESLIRRIGFLSQVLTVNPCSRTRGAAIRTKHPNLSIAIYNGIRSNSKPV